MERAYSIMKLLTVKALSEMLGVKEKAGPL
jgi:hypothetical protein